MDNKNKNKIISILIPSIIAIVAIFAIWTLFSVLSPSLTIDDSPGKKIKLDKESYEKITTPITYGKDISTDESGLGRANPFAPYK